MVEEMVVARRGLHNSMTLGSAAPVAICSSQLEGRSTEF
jgi:hypothetical protein